MHITILLCHRLVNSDDGFEAERFLLAEEDVLVVVCFHQVENITVQLVCSFYLSTWPGRSRRMRSASATISLTISPAGLIS